MEMTTSVIVAGARTPVGKLMGSLNVAVTCVVKLADVEDDAGR